MTRSWRLLPAILLTATMISAATLPSDAADPTLEVQELVTGLDIPWDISFLPDGTMLYTERTRRLVHLRTPAGADTVIVDTAAADAAGIWATGEYGLLGIEFAADFATTRAFITCHTYKEGATQGTRVVRWKLNAAHTAALPARTLVNGLPARTGRHGGCALLKGGHNSLYVGTGDSGQGTAPQKLYSGGGKVLRIDATSGKGLADNPYHSSKNYFAQRIWTYGHRNVQGLARRNDGKTWSNEHGSTVDDEVNLLQKAGNYGWNPVRQEPTDPQYNENVDDSPMTDYSIPGSQVAARWRSGGPTFATSGITFLYGSQWGSYDGALAVTALKDKSLRLMRFSRYNNLKDVRKPAELNNTHGRLRAAVQGPDGALYLTTSNGGGNDKILKVTPG